MSQSIFFINIRKDVLFQIVDGHVLELNLFGTIDVSSIGENADRHPGTRNIGEPASS